MNIPSEDATHCWLTGQMFAACVNKKQFAKSDNKPEFFDHLVAKKK